MGTAKFDVFLPSYSFHAAQNKPSSLYGQLKAVVLECERLGYHSFWIDDHLMLRSSPLLECWTTLSALASATTSIKLGTLVTAAGFRNPGLLAKMAATVDVISGGRLEFGLGCGVQKEEHDAYGFQFLSPAGRVSRMKETAEIVKALWTQPRVSYSGQFYQIRDASCEPKPLQKPYPPIIIGGCGEKHTLKVTAKLADRFDFGYLESVDEFKRKLQLLQGYCELVGRDFGEIEKSCWPTGQILLGRDGKEVEEKIQRVFPEGISRRQLETHAFAGSPEQFKRKLKPYIDLGVMHFILFFGDLPDVGSLQLFAETINES